MNYGSAFYSALISVSVFSLAIIRQSLAGKKILTFAAAETFIAIALLGHLVYSGYFRTAFSYIFFFTFETLIASKLYTNFQLMVIKGLVSGINILVSIVATLALITGCCILADKNELNKMDVNFLVSQMRKLSMFVGIVSILLVTGILHMIAWLRWLTALVANEGLAKHVMDYSEAVSLYWGATFSLIIATFYIPAAWSIRNRAEAIIAEYPEQTQGMDTQEWLKKYNMSLSPLQQVPQLVAMLAPLLVGPIGATLTKFSGPLTGG